MNELSSVFPAIFNFSSIQENYDFKKLKSKRNEVYEVRIRLKMENIPQNFIIKHFLNNTAEIEVKTLRVLSTQGLLVPRIIKYKKFFLILEKIDGENMCDFINFNLTKAHRLSDLEPKIRKSLKNSVEGIAKWFAELHRNNIFQSSSPDEWIVLNKGDVRLRDFIFNPTTKEVFGVDFETAYKGDYLEDLSALCCSFLDTSPGIFETPEPYHKIDLINIFLKKYHRMNKKFVKSFNFDKFSKLLLKELQLIKNRRNLYPNHLDGTKILDTICDPTDF